MWRISIKRYGPFEYQLRGERNTHTQKSRSTDRRIRNYHVFGVNHNWQYRIMRWNVPHNQIVNLYNVCSDTSINWINLICPLFVLETYIWFKWTWQISVDSRFVTVTAIRRHFFIIWCLDCIGLSSYLWR